jgi:hypothetical protein
MNTKFYIKIEQSWNITATRNCKIETEAVLLVSAFKSPKHSTKNKIDPDSQLPMVANTEEESSK